MNNKYNFPGSIILILLMLFLSSTLLLGQQNKQRSITDSADRSASVPLQPVLHSPSPRYLLHIGDSIEIRFRFTPEFDQTVSVQPDGYINLRDLPDMYVAGKSTPEVGELLQKAYSEFLHDPVISVQLKDYVKAYFIAGGELAQPGKYDLRGTTTLLQAIQIAGGLKDSSKHSQVLIFRQLSDQWTEVKEVNVKEMLASKDIREDIRIQPYDMIYVPKNRISKIERFIPSTSLGAYPF